MSRQTLLLIAGLGASVGVPVVMDRLDWLGQEQQPQLPLETVLGKPFPGDTSQQPAEGDLADAAERPLPERVSGPPVADFREIFRFDVTVGWIHNRWGRVSHADRRLDQQGYRVVLVTGTRRDDLAGALTYYFDADHQPVEIHFNGSTGDPSRLIATFRQSYGFSRQRSPRPGVHLYAHQRQGQTLGWLEITPAEELTSDQPYQRYSLTLQLRRAEQQAGMLGGKTLKELIFGEPPSPAR